MFTTSACPLVPTYPIASNLLVTVLEQKTTSIFFLLSAYCGAVCLPLPRRLRGRVEALREQALPLAEPFLAKDTIE